MSNGRFQSHTYRDLQKRELQPLSGRCHDIFRLQPQLRMCEMFAELY